MHPDETIGGDYLFSLRRIATRILQLKHSLARTGNTPQSFCDTLDVLEDVSYEITRTIARTEYGVEITDR
jgi:hypothetical protein